MRPSTVPARLEQDAVVFCQRDRADETRGAIDGAPGAQGFVDQRELVRIGCVRTAESRRLDSRRTVERIDREPRVLGDRQLAGGGRIIQRLQPRVLLEGAAPSPRAR